jgi:hypothetical protein
MSKIEEISSIDEISGIKAFYHFKLSAALASAAFVLA